MNTYGAPLPNATRMPTGIPMGNPMGSPTAVPVPVTAYGAPSPPVAPAAQPAPEPQAASVMGGISNMFNAATSAPVGVAPQTPAQPPPTNAYTGAPKTIGQNGFGLHPDTTPDEIVDYLLPKFQDVESSHDPTNYIGKSKNQPYDYKRSASGLYGYTEGTWNHYKGYARAMDAPAEIQTEKMKADLAVALAKHGNDPYKAVANHYYPDQARDPSKWNAPLPIKDKFGKPINALTVAQYVQKILPAERVARYLQGVNPAGQGSNNQVALQLP